MKDFKQKQPRENLAKILKNEHFDETFGKLPKHRRGY